MKLTVGPRPERAFYAVLQLQSLVCESASKVRPKSDKMTVFHARAIGSATFNPGGVVGPPSKSSQQCRR
jgi:hypothetical protein